METWRAKIIKNRGPGTPGVRPEIEFDWLELTAEEMLAANERLQKERERHDKWFVTASILKAEDDLFPQRPTLAARDEDNTRIAARFLHETDGQFKDRQVQDSGKRMVHSAYSKRTGKKVYLITEFKPAKFSEGTQTVTEYTETHRKIEGSPNEEDARIIFELETKDWPTIFDFD